MADVTLRPLVSAEEVWLVAELADGRRPFVHVVSPSAEMPAGARGRLQSADAASEGEYLIVEVMGDRLPFAAPELALPPAVARRVRKAAGIVDPPPKARRPARAKATDAKASSVKAAPAKAAPGQGAPVKAALVKAAPAKAAPAKAAPVQTAPAKAAPAKAEPAKAEPVQNASASTPAEKAAHSKTTPTKPARRRAPTPITVTINFDGVARWTVEARAGSRRVRPVEIGAGAAAAASDAMGVPEVDALVSSITEAMRRDAEERTEALRAQLAVAEAELARLSR